MTLFGYLLKHSVGTVQLATTLASPYDGIEGTASLIVVPSGVVTSISVLGELNNPLF